MFLCRKEQQCRPFQVFLNCPYSAAAPAKSSRKPTLYEVLGVSEKATMGEIRDAFILKSKESHPDKNPNKPELHERFVQINNAYGVLSNASQRRKYDLGLKAPPVTRPPAGSPFGPVPSHRQSTQQYYYDRATSQSNYRQTRDFDFVYQATNSSRRQTSNRNIVLGALAFMMIGGAVEYFIISSRHSKYKAHAEESSRRNQQIYAEVRERARANGLRKQLEILVSHHTGLDGVAAAKRLQEYFDQDGRE